jgi:hypothetical protein
VLASVAGSLLVVVPARAPDEALVLALSQVESRVAVASGERGSPSFGVHHRPRRAWRALAVDPACPPAMAGFWPGKAARCGGADLSATAACHAGPCGPAAGRVTRLRIERIAGRLLLPTPAT